jgi:hypothetical protein
MHAVIISAAKQGLLIVLGIVAFHLYYVWSNNKRDDVITDPLFCWYNLRLFLFMVVCVVVRNYAYYHSG